MKCNIWIDYKFVRIYGEFLVIILIDFLKKEKFLFIEKGFLSK